MRIGLFRVIISCLCELVPVEGLSACRFHLRVYRSLFEESDGLFLESL